MICEHSSWNKIQEQSVDQVLDKVTAGVNLTFSGQLWSNLLLMYMCSTD